VNWNNHVDFIHNTIRGCDPAPGAWTTIGGKKLQLFGSKKHLVRTFGAVKGKIGEITEIGDTMRITAQGGQVEVSKVKGEETKKISQGRRDQEDFTRRVGEGRRRRCRHDPRYLIVSVVTPDAAIAAMIRGPFIF
jgi:methionyl-tRNA formyltransferase